jgi:hypothetical protein
MHCTYFQYDGIECLFWWRVVYDSDNSPMTTIHDVETFLSTYSTSIQHVSIEKLSRSKWLRAPDETITDGLKELVRLDPPVTVNTENGMEVIVGGHRVDLLRQRGQKSLDVIVLNDGEYALLTKNTKKYQLKNISCPPASDAH